MKHLTLAVIAVLLAATSVGRAAGGETQSAKSAAPPDNTARNRELIRDPHFRSGFRLIDPKPGRRSAYGQLEGLAGNVAPAWDLDQWSSQFPLRAESMTAPKPAVRRWANAGKTVTCGGTDTTAADLSLAVNASVEYGKRARKSGEPWVHLLVEQSFVDPPSIAALTSAAPA